MNTAIKIWILIFLICPGIGAISINEFEKRIKDAESPPDYAQIFQEAYRNQRIDLLILCASNPKIFNFATEMRENPPSDDFRDELAMMFFENPLVTDREEGEVVNGSRGIPVIEVFCIDILQEHFPNLGYDSSNSQLREVFSLFEARRKYAPFLRKALNNEPVNLDELRKLKTGISTGRGDFDWSKNTSDSTNPVRRLAQKNIPQKRVVSKESFFSNWGYIVIGGLIFGGLLIFTQRRYVS